MRNRGNYPVNWQELATRCKERAGWKCEHCGIAQHAKRLSRKGVLYTIYLTAAHKHHDASNPHPELMCLCISCHARYDWYYKISQWRVKIESVKHRRLIGIYLTHVK